MAAAAPSGSQPTSQNASQAVASSADDTSQSRRSTMIELPGYFEDVILDDLVVLIADLLQRMIIHNDQIPLSAEGLTRFHSRSTPGISVLDYLRRIVRYVRVERSVLLLMLHSIDQICTRRPSFNISSLSVHRFIIASITILSKAFCDAFSPNPLFAKVGGVSLIELNLLEREFLSAMDWRLACTREVLHTYYVKLVRTHSSGRYMVPDTSPRPAPIDTLPSDQIEWDVSLFSSGEPSTSAKRRRNVSRNRHGSAVSPDDPGSVSMQTGSADEASEDESSESAAESSPKMATDVPPPRRVPCAAISGTGSPSTNTSTSGTRTGTVKPSFAATLEQNIAFMEMASMVGQGNLAGTDVSTSAATNAMQSSPMGAAPGRSPARAFRSPAVSRRRRRSSAEAEDILVANALLRASGDVVDVGTGATAEGLLRASRRRRIGHADPNERDLRMMEVEPGTPS